MPFRIDDFRAQINPTEFLRTNKFHVRIPYPSAMTAEMRETARYLEFYTDSAQLPGVAMRTNRVARYGYGPFEQRPIMPQFVDANITVLNDGKNNNLSFFRQWLQLALPFNMSKGINTQVANTYVYTTTYRDTYVTDMRITVFDEQGNKRSELVLRDAFPIFLETLRMDWNDTNSVQRFTVTIAYTDWFEEPLTAATTPSPTQPTPPAGISV